MAHGVRRARTRRALAAALLMLAVAACGEDGDKDPEAAPSDGASASPSDTATIPVADPEHSVEPPGPFQGPIRLADILVYDDQPLSDDIVRRINRLRGVAAVERLSLASVSIENRVLTLAAVDPAGYRNFTLAAQHDETWQRVAGGELAVSERVGRQVEDEDSFVRLGSDADAPEVHVGAHADQAFGIDLVVNEKWGEDLEDVGLVPDNGLLISTGTRAPQAVRKPIEQLIGRQASIQMLDVVAREGLDPNAVQVAIPTGGSVATAVGTYRYRVDGGKVTPDPAWVAANIVTDTVPLLGTVRCHKVMMPQLKAALAEVVSRGLGKHVYQTAGCYYPRFIANTTRLSNHAFGMAIDINSLQNQRGTRGQMHPQVVQIFKEWGFAWGGDWRWTDPMHFELSRIVEVG